MAFENTFKAIDNILRHDEGCSTALDYVEQSSWVLFLKYLDDLEETREMSALLTGQTYNRSFAQEYRWSSWAMPKTATGEYDRAVALVGDDLIEFVNLKLFPYLQKFKENYPTDTIEYKVGVIFSEIKNKISSGYNLRDVIEKVNELKFQTAEDRHEMTQLYEDRLKQMGNAGRNGGEYYTPRPLIRTIIKVLNPEIGKTFYDGACGSAGFLCEAYNYMHDKVQGAGDEEQLQKNTFYGKELKGLAYIIAIMNMILHGVESPNIIKTNTLTENLANVQIKDQFDYIGANPPFGGAEREEVQQNFPIKSGETAYMFLQHFIKYLKAGGEAGIVIKNTFLSNTDNASIALRKKLLEDCNLHTILDLPSGIFSNAGVKTVVLFFKKGEPTQKVWYYQLDGHFTKTTALTETDLADFLEKQKTMVDSECSWSINVKDLDANLDMSVKNPNKVEVVDERTLDMVLSELSRVLSEMGKTEKELSQTLKNLISSNKRWEIKKLGDLAKVIHGKNQKLVESPTGNYPIYGSGGNIMGYATEYLCEEGTTILGRKGTINNPLYIDHKFWNVDTAFGIVANEKIDKKLLFYFIKAIDWAKKNTGTTLPSLTQAVLLNTEIPLPPSEEQNRIVAILDTSFDKLNSLNKNANRLILECDTLKQSILRKAFNGEL